MQYEESSFSSGHPMKMDNTVHGTITMNIFSTVHLSIFRKSLVQVVEYLSNGTLN
jgi:hypothetical protein